MPIHKRWTLGNGAIAAIWKIEEPESFFREQTGMSPDIKNEQRRIEHMAGRFLLQYLDEGFPINDIARDEHDKPRLGGNGVYFSISHSWPYVAAMIDTVSEAGIDIQTWHPRIERLQYKFLSHKEQEMFGNDMKMITLAWSAKEAVYKWAGRRGIDFIEHMPIQRLIPHSEHHYDIIILLKIGATLNNVFVSNVLDADYVLSTVVVE